MYEYKYWMTTCTECCGKGQIPYKSPMYKVFTRLQDEGWELTKSYEYVKDAEDYVAKLKAEPLGDSCMYAIVSPDGRVVGE